MSIFGPIIGHLPLLNLPAAKLSKLSGQRHWDAMEQLRHHCIRKAWLLSTQFKLNVRETLDLVVGRACKVWADARGHEVCERFLDMDMEHARRMNELWTCFGFFLPAEIDHLMKKHHVGPVLAGVLPPDLHALGPFNYAEFLENRLNECRDYVRRNELAHETVCIVQQITGAPRWLDQTPPEIGAFFDLGRLMREVVEERVRVLQDNGKDSTLH